MLLRAKTYHKAIWRSHTSQPSDPVAKKQLVKFGHAQKAKFRNMKYSWVRFQIKSKYMQSLGTEFFYVKFRFYAWSVRAMTQKLKSPLHAFRKCPKCKQKGLNK